MEGYSVCLESDLVVIAVDMCKDYDGEKEEEEEEGEGEEEEEK